MSFHSWLQNLRSTLASRRGQNRQQRHDSLRATTHRPNLEVLEDRLAPSFTPVAWHYSVGPDPAFAVWTGDFNNDGHLDLATNGPGNGQVVLLGDGRGFFGYAGDGTFADPIYSTGLTAEADFNGDGRLDVVKVFGTMDPGGGAVQAGLGREDGTFEWQDWFEVALEPQAIVTGDFNGDGLPDLAVGGYDYFLSGGAVAVLINDGDWASLRIYDVTVTERNTGTTAITFAVTLDAASTEPITVAYATSNGSATAGSDYQGASGTLTFAPGETSKTVTVAVYGDRLAEPNETFVVNLSAPTNATIADGQGVGTIFDDEPRMSINDVTATEGNTGTVNATFTVSLSVAYDVAVTVHYQTANGSATAGSDYAAASGDVTIAAGQTSKTFTVAVIGDRSAEPTETFVVNLSAATNGLIVDSQGVGAILDNEPRISISDVTKTEGKKGQTTLFTFTVTLSAAYDQAVTMSFQTVNGTAKTSDSDYIAKSGTLTFNPGETTKTITIEVKGDSKKEANEYFYLDLFGNSDNSLFSKNRGIGTILNDD